MVSIAHMSDGRVPMLAHCVEVGKRPLTLVRYTGLQYIAALGENSSRERSNSQDRPAAQWKISGFEMLRLQRPPRCYDENPPGFS